MCRVLHIESSLNQSIATLAQGRLDVEGPTHRVVLEHAIDHIAIAGVAEWNDVDLFRLPLSFKHNDPVVLPWPPRNARAGPHIPLLL